MLFGGRENDVRGTRGCCFGATRMMFGGREDVVSAPRDYYMNSGDREDAVLKWGLRLKRHLSVAREWIVSGHPRGCPTATSAIASDRDIREVVSSRRSPLVSARSRLGAARMLSPLVSVSSRLGGARMLFRGRENAVSGVSSRSRRSRECSFGGRDLRE